MTSDDVGCWHRRRRSVHQTDDCFWCGVEGVGWAVWGLKDFSIVATLNVLYDRTKVK